MELYNPGSKEKLDNLVDDYLEKNGHIEKNKDWEKDNNKKKCPKCGGLHNLDATICTCCEWTPTVK